MNDRIAILAAGLVLASATHAQTRATPPSTPTTVLKAAHLFDGRSGKLVSPGLVMVQSNKIIAVGANAVIPADAKLIDLGDATLVPGYIDAETGTL